jgi:hypothetical protein
MQADQGLAASTRARAEAAAINRRLAERKVLDRPGSEREAIDLVMMEIAAHGLMEIGFLDSGRNSGGDFGRLGRLRDVGRQPEARERVAVQADSKPRSSPHPQQAIWRRLV